ncbi:hypothetical protein [Bacillus sp. JJ1764]|uniref:hypothetical protein n=1 Tax=Bacillus sp. JJ1764 TaxID=3122964 RepID=UPI002FFF5763
MAKKAFQFSKRYRTTFHFQKLKMCKKCNRYSVLNEESCPKCGTPFIGIEILTKKIVKNRLLNEILWILIFVCIGIIASPTVQTLYYTLISGSTFCMGYIVLTLSFFKTEYVTELKKLLRVDLRKIKAGLHYDSELAKEDTKAGRLVSAYEKLREIGEFIHADQVKIRRIMILNDIILRTDMDLELESLIPSRYDKDFVNYALEILKLKRNLFTKKCIAYFVTHRLEIIRDFGVTPLIAAAGTALRMKLYILEFSGFIEDFLEYLPKDRILRLCQMMYANPDVNWGSLGEKTQRLVAVKYHYDPDFKRFALEERIPDYAQT